MNKTTQTIDELDKVAEPTNTDHPGINKLAENEEHAATTPRTTKHSVNSTDATSLYTTRVKRKTKSNSSHGDFMKILKKREQQRQESSIYQKTQISNDGRINSFYEHSRVLQTLPPPLAV